MQLKLTYQHSDMLLLITMPSSTCRDSRRAARLLHRQKRTGLRALAQRGLSQTPKSARSSTHPLELLSAHGLHTSLVWQLLRACLLPHHCVMSSTNMIDEPEAQDHVRAPYIR